MQALLKTPSNVAFTSKVIVQDTCCCWRWKHNRGIFVSPMSKRRLATSIPVAMNVSNEFIHVAFDRWKRKPNSYVPSALLVIGKPRKDMTNLNLHRKLSVSQVTYEKEPLKPSSKVEETVKAIKTKSETQASVAVEKPKIKKDLAYYYNSLKDGLKHIVHGTWLLILDINISRKLVWRILNGKTLSRREHRLLVRTVGDIFRLIPFSVFIIVPFMELALPLVIKFFPGILPTTFQTATDREDRQKQSLKVRLEMAKFLQTTLDDMSLQSKDKDSESSKQFTEFFKKIRSSGEAPSNEDIIKFSTLFEDEIILDSLSKPQMMALCRVLDMRTVGTTNLLRFQIRMRLRNLAADDQMIVKEGVDALNAQELQAACQARAMRAYGVSEDQMKDQLTQWLNLSVNEKVPPSLLLLSRALLLPDTITPTDQLKVTISSLPEAVELKAKAAIIEREGIIDNRTKIDLIKEEEKQIREERDEQREEDQKKVKIEELQDKAPILSDTAPDIEAIQKKDEITSEDIEVIEDALDTLGKEKKKLLVEKEELDDLKEEMQDYQEDVKELQEVMATSDKKGDFRETKAAKNLFKKVNKMISKMDVVLSDLESKGQKIKEAEATEKTEEVVKIDELMNAIKKIQKISDDSKLDQISKVLAKMDDDHDGAISVDEVLKVIELIGNENVELTSKQLDEIMELIEKEEALEIEGQIEKALEKQSSVEKVLDTPSGKDGATTLGEMGAKSSEALKKEATVSVSPDGKPTIAEPKDISNGGSKKL